MAIPGKSRVVVRRPPERRPFVSRGADVFCLVLGVTTSFSVHLVGDLYMAETLLALAFPILAILRIRRALRPELKMIYVLMGFWLLGLIVADAYNHTPITDRMRGMALIVFFAINLFGMSMLLGHNEKRKMLYFSGLAFGALAAVKLQPYAAAEEYPWKFGYATGTIMVVMLVSSYFYSRRKLLISGLLIPGICAVNLILNYRGPVLDLLVTLVLVYPIVPERLGGIQILPRSQAVRLLVLLALAIGAGEAAGGLVNFVTRAGYVNEDAQAKNEAQAKTGNLLLGGRPEFAIGLQAALDSPIIGHGSWAKDLKYFEMLHDAMVESGMYGEQRGDIDQEADGLIPGHSHIVTAWVWAGIAGPIFWLYVAWFVCRGMAQIAVARPPLAPFYMFSFIGMFWDILFSPFAANRRFTEAVMIVVLADLASRRIRVLQPSWRRMGTVGYGRPVPHLSNPAAPSR